MVFEAAPYKEGDSADTPAEWSFVRIASLRSDDKPWGMGLFSFAPVEQKGCICRFHHFLIGPREDMAHDGDSSAMKSTVEGEGGV